jgi:hydrogenase/urease accessory protein HupE
MNIFEKICMVVTIPVGAIFMVLGVIGLFTGCNAHFTLPPILGAIPFFLGFAMCVCLVRYWKLGNERAKGKLRTERDKWERDAKRLAKNEWE